MPLLSGAVSASAVNRVARSTEPERSAANLSSGVAIATHLIALKNSRHSSGCEACGDRWGQSVTNTHVVGGAPAQLSGFGSVSSSSPSV